MTDESAELQLRRLLNKEVSIDYSEEEVSE